MLSNLGWSQLRLWAFEKKAIFGDCDHIFWAKGRGVRKHTCSGKSGIIWLQGTSGFCRGKEQKWRHASPTHGPLRSRENGVSTEERGWATLVTYVKPTTELLYLENCKQMDTKRSMGMGKLHSTETSIFFKLIYNLTGVHTQKNPHRIFIYILAKTILKLILNNKQMRITMNILREKIIKGGRNCF